MRSIVALAVLFSGLLAGCCEPEYRPYQAQPVYCVPQAQQIQQAPAVCCPTGTVPVQCQ